MAKRKNSEVTASSGNVFADLALSNPEERLAKVQIAFAIHKIAKDRGLSQAKAGLLMGIDQPKVSKILHGRLSEFSAEWLLARLLKMGLDIEIIVREQSRRRSGTGEISVVCT